MALKRTDYLQEINYPGPLTIGTSGPDVKRLQQWLNLQRVHTPGYKILIVVDKEFGEITAGAIKAFQTSVGIKSTGELDENTWNKLVSPMVNAFKPIKFEETATIADRALAYMRQFLANCPTELSSNRGPWVRAFMKGLDSDNKIATGDWAQWCNGCISTAIDHACHSMDITMDAIYPWTWSCFDSVLNARSEKYTCRLIVREEVKKSGFEILPGDLAISTNAQGKPQHILMADVIGNDGKECTTVEGNTNDEGSASGYEMASDRKSVV